MTSTLGFPSWRSSLGSLAALAFAAASLGCAGDDSASQSQDQDLRQQLQEVTIRGYVVGDYASGSKAAAERSWTETCEAWQASVRAAAAGASLRDMSCGEAENLRSSGYQLTSMAEVTLAVLVPEGSALVESNAEVIGATHRNLTESLDYWKAACAAEVERARALYGDRLIAATCDRAENMHPSKRKFASALRLVVRPGAGPATAFDGYVYGPDASYEDAYAGWKAACDDWVNQRFGEAGARVLGHRCGEPVDIDDAPSGYRFVSQPVVDLDVTFPEPPAEEPPVDGDAEQPVEGDEAPEEIEEVPPPVAIITAGPYRYGDSTGVLATAFDTWKLACDTEIARQSERFGERVLAASCGAPEQVPGRSDRQFASSVRLVLTPVRGTEIVAEGYVLGAKDGTWTDAQRDFEAQAEAWQQLAVGQVGVEATTGVEISVPTDLDEGNALWLGAPATLRFAMELPEGAEPIRIDAEPVSGASGNFDPALASWREACESAIEEQRAIYGEQHLVTLCGAPQDMQASGARFESSLTVWIRP